MSSPLTSHVLDTATGRPAAGLDLVVDRLHDGQWERLCTGKTNTDGRAPGLLTQDEFAAGTYRVTFATGPWLAAQNQPVFYPEAAIVFVVDSPTEHYHIPLLLSPFGYSTYRGS